MVCIILKRGADHGDVRKVRLQRANVYYGGGIRKDTSYK